MVAKDECYGDCGGCYGEREQHSREVDWRILWGALLSDPIIQDERGPLASKSRPYESRDKHMYPYRGHTEYYT